MRHHIYTRNEQDKFLLTPAMRALVRRAIAEALRYEAFDRPAEVSVTFTDNEEIRQLNASWRGIDRATDVLSFPMSDEESGENRDGDCVLLGDIVISAERAAEQAEEYGHTLARELAFLAVHSTLHLLGYDHERSAEEEKEMFRRQEEILCGMGLKRTKEDQ